MIRLTIDLPDDVARDLEAQAREAGKSRDEYAAQQITVWLAYRREELERFHQLIREGEESGESIPMDDAYFERLRQRLRERLNLDPSTAEAKAKAS